MRRKSFFLVLSALIVCGSIVGITACTSRTATEAQKAAIRANDIATCNNLMSLHAWYHSAFLNNVEVEKLWVKLPENTPTAVWAQNAKYWIGLDNIKAYYGEVRAREATRGQFQFHTVSTGVVEIAEDRKTAKGVWYTPGIIGGAGRLSGLWERYAIDFAMENGEWKIWHLHVYTDFGIEVTSGGGRGGGASGGAPQGTGAQGAPDKARGAAPAASGAPAAGSTGASPAGGAASEQSAAQDTPEKAETFGAESLSGGQGPNVPAQVTAEVGYNELSADSYPDLIPRPPEPYKTFSETWSYGDPNEVKMFSGEYKEWSEIKAGR